VITGAASDSTAEVARLLMSIEAADSERRRKERDAAAAAAAAE
jgi:hypothetical protein